MLAGIMDRLDRARIAGPAQKHLAKFHPDVVAEVRAAIDAHDVVVVGMALNGHVRKVKAALDDANVGYHYLEYGGYASEWRRRLALKLWTGWPTFPMVFVKGTLVGGEDLTKAALADGSLQKILGDKKR
jgi:glutaredoxin-related protein